MDLAKLFDSNFVYFAAYLVFTASVGQYVLWKKVSTFITDIRTAYGKAKKVVAKRQRAETVDVKAVELVSRPDIKFKVNQKEAEKYLEHIRMQRHIDAGMHNLTSKYSRSK